ncbi:MAG: magnesium transporter [bacterium]|nr:magnesium transporter [bacterium]
MKKDLHRSSLETAEKIMVDRDLIPVFFEHETIATMQKEFSRRAKEYAIFQNAYVTDKRGVLQGIIPVPHLLRASAETVVKDITNKEVPSVSRTADQEDAALVALRQSVDSIAVIDGESRLLGVIPASAIIRVLHQEHMEDLLKSAGIHSEASRMLHEKAPALVSARLPWLVVGLAGGVVASFIAKAFEGSLREHFILASFIPLVVYVAGAIGTQTSALYVRGLLLGVESFWAYMKRELLVGMGISAVLSALLFLVISVLFSSVLVGATLGISLFLTGTISVLIPLGIVKVLDIMGKDPAMGAGPVTTIISDVISLAVYLFVATTLFSFML